MSNQRPVFRSRDLCAPIGGQYLASLGEADHSKQPQFAAHGLGDLRQRLRALRQILESSKREDVEEGQVRTVWRVGQVLKETNNVNFAFD